MSTLRFTKLQRAILDALSSAHEKSNAQVAAAAECSEAYASQVLSRFERAKLARSRRVQDADDPQTHYRMWRKGAA